MDGGITPVGGPGPMTRAEIEPSRPVMHEADKVDRLSPVPKGGVPAGHPLSFPVQGTRQVSLGGTGRAEAEEAVALKAISEGAYSQYR